MKADVNTYRGVTPYLVVQDADAEIKFLKAAFAGTETVCERNPDKTVKHAEIQIGNSLIMLGQARDAWKPTNASLYLWVSDVDATYHKALEAGASSQSAPGDQPYGHRNAGVVDVSGVTWWIGSPVA